MRLRIHNLKYLILLSVLSACNNPHWETSPSGLRYRIVSIGNGIPVTMGATVKIYVHRTFKDSTVFMNFETMPEYVQLIPGLISPYGAQEALLYHVHEGDSLQIVQRGDSLVAKGILKFLRPGTTAEDEWITGIRVVKVFPNDPVHSLQADSLIAADKKKEKDRLDAFYKIEGPKHITEYLWEHHIKENPEILGLRQAQGDTAQKYLEVRVLSLSNQLWIYRDSVPYQKGTLPQRIDTSISQFSRGAHLRYYLPSMDAFGAATPEGIPSYSDLIFDIKIK